MPSVFLEPPGDGKQALGSCTKVFLDAHAVGSVPDCGTCHTTVKHLSVGCFMDRELFGAEFYWMRQRNI